jgi:hypothetical protein
MNPSARPVLAHIVAVTANPVVSMRNQVLGRHIFHPLYTVSITLFGCCIT